MNHIASRVKWAFQLGGALLAAGALGSASAAPYTVTTNYNIGGGNQSAPVTACGTNGIDALEFTGSATGSIGIHTYGCSTDGTYGFGTRSSGRGTYNVNGNVTFSETLSGSSFLFAISPGEIGAFGSETFTGADSQAAQLFVYLSIDGNVYLDEQFAVTVDSSGLSYNYSSFGSGSLFTSLNVGAASAQYNIFGNNFLVDGLSLGSHSILYYMTSSATGVAASASNCFTPDSFGGNGEFAFFAAAAAIDGGPTSYQVYCGAGARVGDPIEAPIAQAVPVPVPMTFALLGVGLWGIGQVRRRA